MSYDLYYGYQTSETAAKLVLDDPPARVHVLENSFSIWCCWESVDPLEVEHTGRLLRSRERCPLHYHDAICNALGHRIVS